MKNPASRLAAIGFCISLAFSYSLMGFLVKSYSAFFSAFATYAITSLFFFSLRVRHLGSIWAKARPCWKNIAAINLITLCIVLLAFEALRWITPTCYAIAFFGTTPAWAGGHANQHQKMKAATLALVCTACAIATNPSISAQVLLWTGMAILSAYFGVFYMRRSAALQKQAALSSGDVMMLRFILSILVCGTLFQDDLIGIAQDMRLLLVIVTTAFTSTIIPLYLMQKSIATAGVEKTSQWFPLIPALSLPISILTGQIQPSPAIIAATVISALSLLFYLKPARP